MNTNERAEPRREPYTCRDTGRAGVRHWFSQPDRDRARGSRRQMQLAKLSDRVAEVYEVDPGNLWIFTPDVQGRSADNINCSMPVPALVSCLLGWCEGLRV